VGGIINPSGHIAWGRGAVGSASDWQSEGQGFESPRLHQIFRIDVQSDVNFIASLCPRPNRRLGNFAQYRPPYRDHPTISQTL
jgi:hypothetical protein